MRFLVLFCLFSIFIEQTATAVDRLIKPLNFRLRLKDTETLDKKKIDQLRYLVQTPPRDPRILDSYLEIVKEVISTLKPAPSQRPSLVWVEAVKTYLLITKSFNEMAKDPDAVIRNIALQIATNYASILPANICESKNLENLLNREPDFIVRKAAVKLISIHCKNTEGTESLKKRALLERVFSVQKSTLIALTSRMKTESDLLFLLKRIEKLPWKEETKEILKNIKPLEGLMGLDTLYKRLIDSEQKLARILPAAYLSGVWGLFGLQEILILENPTKGVLEAAMEGVKALGYFEWDELFSVETYKALLDSKNESLVQLASLVLINGKKATSDSLEKMRDTLKRTDLSPLTHHRVQDIAGEITIDEINEGLKSQDPEEKIRALEKLADRSSRVEVYEHTFRDKLILLTINSLKDISPEVRIAAAKALQAKNISAFTSPPEYAHIVTSLTDEDPRVRKEIIAFFEKRPRLSNEFKTKVLLAKSNLDETGKIGGLESPTQKIREQTLNQLSLKPIRSSVIIDQLKEMAQNDKKPQFRSQALMLLYKNSTTDEKLEDLLFKVAETDASPEVSARAVSIIGEAFPNNYNIFFKIMEIVKYSRSAAHLRIAYAAPLQNWPIQKLTFDSAQDKKDCENLIGVLISGFKYFKADKGREVVAKWLQTLLELAKEEVESMTFPLTGLSSSFSVKEYRPILLRPLAVLFALAPEKARKVLEPSLTPAKGGVLSFDLITSGNRKLTPDILKASSEEIKREWIKTIRAYDFVGETLSGSLNDIYVLIEYLKSNLDDDDITQAIVAKIDELAPRILESSDFIISRSLWDIAQDIDYRTSIRKQAATAIGRLKSQNIEIKTQALDLASRLPSNDDKYTCPRDLEKEGKR